MGFNATPGSITTLLMVAFAVFVIYTRFKNWLDSNVPIFFYIILVIFMNSVDVNLPHLLVYVAFALGLTMRFEFMNKIFIRIVKTLEICALLAIIYFCVTSVILP